MPRTAREAAFNAWVVRVLMILLAFVCGPLVFWTPEGMRALPAFAIASFLFMMLLKSTKQGMVLSLIYLLNASGKVLDFGAGTGSLAACLCETGRFAKVDAVDLVDYSAARHPEVHWLFSDLNEPLPVADETYDGIVAAEVIEHLENPRMLAREWFRLLKPGGALVVSTPNNESWRSLISLAVRGHYADFTGASYPAHITALLRKDLERILNEAGFVQIEFDFTHCGGIPGRPLLRWQSVSFGLLKGVRFSDNVVCSARKPT